MGILPGAGRVEADCDVSYHASQFCFSKAVARSDGSGARRQLEKQH